MAQQLVSSLLSFKAVDILLLPQMLSPPRASLQQFFILCHWLHTSHPCCHNAFEDLVFMAPSLFMQVMQFIQVSTASCGHQPV